MQVQVRRHLHCHAVARKLRSLPRNGPEICLLNMRQWSHKEIEGENLSPEVYICKIHAKEMIYLSYGGPKIHITCGGRSR